ncbi:cytochrome b [Lentisalinibacter orientalis]|uniref:cytochrome b n=1 Tax=Lentisalinibacter orientalis TaxID=2992241 RepID=UPI0038689A82
MRVPLRNTAAAWGLVAQLLHWLVVVGVGLQFVWAWRIDEADSVRVEFALVNQHKSIGMTVLALAVIRLAWRLVSRTPDDPPTMARWERIAASASHWTLYGLILAIPLTGWAYTSAAGYGAEFFGLIDLPDLAPSDEDLEDLFVDAHEFLGQALLAVTAVHAGAALRHHFLLRDDVLRRMLPFGK